MKQITYNNKTIKLPFADADYSDTPLEMETVKNPFSGQSIAMPRFAAQKNSRLASLGSAHT